MIRRRNQCSLLPRNVLDGSMKLGHLHTKFVRSTSGIFTCIRSSLERFQALNLGIKTSIQSSLHF